HVVESHLHFAADQRERCGPRALVGHAEAPYRYAPFHGAPANRLRPHAMSPLHSALLRGTVPRSFGHSLGHTSCPNRAPPSSKPLPRAAVSRCARNPTGSRSRRTSGSVIAATRGRVRGTSIAPPPARTGSSASALPMILSRPTASTS